MSNHLGDANKMVKPETYMTIHSDGRITVSDKLKPDETAAFVLECMKTQFLGDAQATKIRELQSNLNESNELIEHLQDKIKRLEEAGDAMSWTLNSENWLLVGWRKAKESKP